MAMEYVCVRIGDTISLPLLTIPLGARAPLGGPRGGACKPAVDVLYHQKIAPTARSYSVSGANSFISYPHPYALPTRPTAWDTAGVHHRP